MHVDFLLFVIRFVSQMGLGIVFRKVDSRLVFEFQINVQPLQSFSSYRQT